jgi:hypothetical protein
MPVHFDTETSKESIDVVCFGTTIELPLELTWEKKESRSTDGYPIDPADLYITQVRFKFHDKWTTVNVDDLTATSSIIPRTIFHALEANTWEAPRFG